MQCLKNGMKGIPGSFSKSSSSFAEASLRRVSALANFAFRVTPADISRNRG